MGSNTNNLDPQSLLMLYVADELTAEQRKRVEQMLAKEAGLRAQLDELTAADQVMMATFAAADAKTPLPAPLSSSVRRASDAIRQWQVDRLSAQPAMSIRNGRKFGWLYSAAAVAAVIVITVFVLWSRVDDGKNDDLAKLMNQLNSNQTVDDKSANDTVATDDVADYTPTGGDAEMQLSRAEDNLNTLTALTDSLRPTPETVTP
jgi:hypothetical protein